MRNRNQKIYAVLMSMALILTAGSTHADSCDDANAICAATSGNVSDRIADPKCKNDPACVSCMGEIAGNSQVGIQCAAYKKSKKGQTGEIINASLNTVATITCGIQCVLDMNPETAANSTTWNKICGFAGLAVTASEIGFTIANMVNGQKADWLGLAVKTATTTSANLALAQGATAVTSATASKMSKLSNSHACMNTAIFGIAAAMKWASISKANKSKKQSCGNIKDLSDGSSSTLQTCLGPNSLASNSSGQGLAGFFTPTNDTFTPATIDDVDHQASTMGQYLQGMKSDLKFAQDQGKFDLSDISKKIEAGSKISDLLAGSGIPGEILGGIKTAEEEFAKDDGKLSALASTTGSPGASGTRTGGSASDNGLSEMGFGLNGNATPGEGAESLSLGRKPANENTLLDGDIFHGTFPGTIFEIITTRLKAQKGSYAELVPEGRMNRLFNGYRDEKKTRKPAGKK